jgi:tetratricopeptide (TPR) repeat protein
VTALQEILKHDGENLKARQSLAEALEQEDKHEAAGYEYLRLAARLLEKGDLEAAFSSASKAVKYKQSDGQLLLAQIHSGQNQPDLAQLALEEFLKEKPRHSEALKLLLNLVRSKGDVEETQKAALKLCQADPAEPAGYEVLADVYESQNQFIKANGMLLQAAEAYMNRGQFEQSRALIQRVLSKDSSHPVGNRLWQRLVQAYPSAAPILSQAALVPASPAVNPSQLSDPESLKSLSSSELYEGLKHFDNAIAGYRQMLRLQPENEALRQKLNQLYKLMAQANDCKL